MICYMKILLILVLVLLLLLNDCNSYVRNIVKNNRLSSSNNRIIFNHYDRHLSKLSMSSSSSPSLTSSFSSLANIIDIISKSKLTKRVISWTGFIALAYALQSFYTIIIATFFFSVFGTNIVDIFQSIYEKITNSLKLPKKLKLPRKAFVTLYIVLLGLTLTRSVLYFSPRIVKESQYFLSIMQSEDPYTTVAKILSNTFGPELVGRLESVIIAAKSIQLSKDIAVLDSSRRLGKLLQVVTTDYLQSLITFGSRVLSDSTAVLYKGITALIFSLITVWDLPQISKGVSSLENSRVGFVYKEIAPKLQSFGNLVAQSFEVQAMIAFVNCALISVGLYLLKIPGLGFFSLLTLVSSFIPVAGIIIATLPPLLAALAEYGIMSGVQLLAMVTFVHALEAYLIYPQIYSYRLKMHPLFVLSSLTIAEHFAGIQGMHFFIYYK